METRRIRIIDSKKQSQKTIESTATTLGELKREIRAAGIDFDSSSSFHCGEMRAELKDDAAPIPATVMYKGVETSNLTFMITTTQKKIKSGAMSRNDAYAEIKRLNLQEVCKIKYKKNFTQCSTDDLIKLINSNAKKNNVETPKTEVSKVETPKQEPEVKAEAPKTENKEEPKPEVSMNNPRIDNIIDCIKKLLGELSDNDYIDSDVYDECIDLLEGITNVTNESSKDKKMSKREIDEMFDYM